MIFINYKKIIYIILLLAVTSFTGFSQSENANLRGKITDTNSAIISGAEISAQNKVSGREIKTQTNESGEFEFSDLPSGIYTVKVDAAGFSTQTRDVSLNDSETISDFDIALSVGNITETVSVTATRTQVATDETAVPVSVLTQEEIEQKNVSTIGDVLRDLPGVTTVNEGSFQVRPRIRGLDSNRVLVLVDGERLNNGRTSTTQSGIELGLIDTGQIETLEVVRGSGSVLYGTDALAGTINIITKDAPRNADGGFRFGGSFAGYFGSNETGRRGTLAVTGTGRFFSFRAAQTLERYENYYTGDFGSNSLDGVTVEGEVLNSQSHGGNTQLTTRFFLNDTNQLKFNYTRRRTADIGSPTLVGVFNAFFPYSNRDKFNAGYEGTNLNKYLARISANVYFQRQNRNFTNILNVPATPPFFPGVYQFSETATNTDSTGFDLQTNWILGEKNFLTAGMSFFRDSNEDERFIEARNPNFATFPPTLVTTFDNSKSVPDSSYGSIAVFAQNQFQATNRLKLTGGIRVDRFNTESESTVGFSLPAELNQVSPQIIESLGISGLLNGSKVSQTALTGDFGVVYKIVDSVSLTGRIGRSFRVPNLFERFFTGAGSVGGIVVGNPNLEPESGINFDAGVKFNNSKVAGTFIYFNNTYKNFLSSVQIFDANGAPVLGNRGGLFQTQNIASARIQGFEADVQIPIKIGLGFLTPSGNISYLRGDNLDANEPLNTITPLKTVLNLRWQNLLANYYVDWTTRIINKQERLSNSFFNNNGGAEPGFATSDVRGGYTYKKERYRMSFNVGVTNLFNRFYREQFSFAPARGRSFVFGTTLEIF